MRGARRIDSVNYADATRKGSGW